MIFPIIPHLSHTKQYQSTIYYGKDENRNKIGQGKNLGLLVIVTNIQILSQFLIIKFTDITMFVEYISHSWLSDGLNLLVYRLKK